MAINRWRVVKYTDDGCYLYQCLNCKRQWEGRDAPGHTEAGGYLPNWRYCPYCATQWECSQRESEDEYGPRRQRIFDAMWERRREFRSFFYWVFEVETFPGKWVPLNYTAGEIVSARRVLEYARKEEMRVRIVRGLPASGLIRLRFYD